MAATELIGICLSKFLAAFPDGFEGHDHSAGKKQFLHIADTQAEVGPHPI
jgi:hypothetical protein